MPKILGLFQQLNLAKNPPPGAKPPPVSFVLTEAEVNDYLAYSLKTNPRPGLDSTRVKFFPGNYISTFIELDFDAVEKWKPGTIPTLLRPVLGGKKAVWVDIRFAVNSSLATFTIEKAYYQSVRIPALVVEKMIQVVAARQPEKYDTSKPVPLPFGLKHAWTGAQKAGGNT